MTSYVFFVRQFCKYYYVILITRIYTVCPIRYNTEKTLHRVITDTRRIVDTDAIETRLDQIFIHLTILFFSSSIIRLVHYRHVRLSVHCVIVRSFVLLRH